MIGPIRRFLAADHARLARLIDRLGEGDRAADDELRAGLLRHLAWEETVLLPLAQRLREGERLPCMTRVRLEHRAIRALLVPTPRPVIVRALGRVLAVHAAFEEAPGGFYDSCDTLVSSDADAMVDRLRAVTAPVPAPHEDGAAIDATVRQTLRQARLPALDDT